MQKKAISPIKKLMSVKLMVTKVKIPVAVYVTHGGINYYLQDDGLWTIYGSTLPIFVELKQRKPNISPSIVIGKITQELNLSSKS